jgi:hypothetical protein
MIHWTWLIPAFVSGSACTLALLKIVLDEDHAAGGT